MPEALGAFVRRLSAARSPEQVFHIVSQGVRALLQADGATFVLSEGDQCYYADEDAISPLWKGRRFAQETCISGWCMQHGEPVAIPDIYEDPRIPVDAYRPTFVRSLIMVPVGGDRPIAALGAYWSERRVARPADLVRLQTIADAAALALASLRPETTPAAQPSGPGPIAESIAAGHNALRRLPAALRREGLRPNSLAAYGLAIACVAVATLVREAVRATGVEGLATFSTYYPAVLFAMLVGGRRAGVLAAVLGGFAAYFFFMPPVYTIGPLTISEFLNLGLYGAASTLIVLIIDWYQHAVLKLRREDAEHLTLAREQRHRLTNAISVVESVVQQTLRDQPERARTINRRVRAGLARHIALDADARGPFRLRDLLVSELQPFDLSRFVLEGGDEALSAETHSLVALTVHELATNALKYGALSAPQGAVSVAWRVRGSDTVIDWRETGGPAVEPPARRGYGSVLIGRLAQAIGGSTAIEFPATGVTAEIRIPLAPVPSA